MNPSKGSKHPLIKGIIVTLFFLVVSRLISPNFLSIGRRNFSDDIQIIAHRGSATYVPENTLAALDYSIQHGADMAEIDVQMTQDGEVILMHDSISNEHQGMIKRSLKQLTNKSNN